MRPVRRAMIALSTVLLVSCSTPYRASVSTFHTLDGRPLPTFALVPYPDQEGSLEYRTYAETVRAKLIERGFREAPSEQAAVTVFLRYRVDDGRQITTSSQVWGPTGTASSYTTASASTYGGTASGQATTTNTPRWGPVGTRVNTNTVYRREVDLDMVDRAATVQQNKLVKVYEAKLTSEGTVGELPAVMPYLLSALFEQFPAASGSTRTVTCRESSDKTIECTSR